MENFKKLTIKELQNELSEKNCEILELKQFIESLINEKDELEYSLSECYTESEVKEKHNNLFKKIEKLNDELEEVKIENDFLSKINKGIAETNISLREENDFLTKERDEIHNILCGYRKVNGELAQEVKELKNQIEYLDECMQILVEENNKLCSLETFNSQFKTKEQHELEQATLLVDNLLEQLAKAEKEVLILTNDKKKLQLLNERMNNCIKLQSQEIFKLLK